MENQLTLNGVETQTQIKTTSSIIEERSLAGHTIELRRRPYGQSETGSDAA